MARALLLLVCAPYLGVAVAYLEARRRGETAPRWARFVGLATVCAHLAALILLAKSTGRSPFQTESQALSFLAWSVAALYAVLEVTSGIATYGGRFWMLAAVLAAVGVPGLAEEVGCAPAITVPDSMRSFHVGFALLGTAAIVAGGLLATAYLGTYRRIKSRLIVPGATEGPSLFGLQRLARDASFAGLVLLGPSLVLGWMVLRRVNTANVWATVELGLAALQFGLVLVAAFLWWRRPLRGAVAAWLNVAATLLAVVAFGVVHPLLTRAGGG